MPGSLKSNELSQWTHGNADLVAKLLFNLFSYLKLETNEGKDANLTYRKVAENIGNFISLQGEQRLHIPQTGRASIDASALLGAYLRLGITLNDKPIVELSAEQIEVVHSFVKPLIPEGFTPKQFFDGLNGTPSQKHAAILKLLLFKDIPPEHLKEMFKGKYVEKVNNLIDSVLNLVDFMRTPFSLLVSEEKASVAAAKQSGKEHAQTSGIDLQWTSMYKAIEQSIEDIIDLKKGKAGEAEKFLKEIRPSLNQCQQCFGIANTRYQVEKELAVETKKREEELQTTRETLQEKTTALEESDKLLKRIRQQNEALTLELTEASKRFEQQHLELDRLQKVESTSKETIENLRKEIQKAGTDVQQKSTALEKLDRQLQVVQKENEELRKKLSSAQEHELTITDLKQQLENLRKENNLLRQQPAIAKHSAESPSEIPSEVTQLRSQLEKLQQENAGLKKELLKAKQPLPNSDNLIQQPKLTDFDDIKADLLIDLGELLLNQEDRKKIKDKITTSTDQTDLSAVDTEIKRLQKVNKFIEQINNGILERAGFFSSDPHKKTKAIETAFQQLSIKDKFKLSTLSEDDINAELSKEGGEESDLGKFLKAIHHKRGFIPIRGATSFTFFKNGISHLKQDLDKIDAQVNVL